MPSHPPSAPTGVSGQGRRITASLAQQSGQSAFEVTFQGETVPLGDSGSINRWTAIGVVDRHEITLLSDGVSIDGRKILYSDSKAPADLERILNRSETPHPRSSPRTAGGAGHAGSQTMTVSEASALASLVDSVRVTRDGFEYRVTFRTRFGESKTAQLSEALEAFQRMRMFKPHLNMQKSGIRLVATRWDGENFVGQPGIENLEHATPEQVQALIKANLQGGPDATAAAASAHDEHARRRVVRVDLVKKPHDARFHLVYRRHDGTAEEGLLLIRANMAKLGTCGVFRPDVSVSMSTMNDLVVVQYAQKDGRQPVRPTEEFRLVTLEDAKNVEAALNRCLITTEEPQPERITLELPLPPHQAAGDTIRQPILQDASVAELESRAGPAPLPIPSLPATEPPVGAVSIDAAPTPEMHPAVEAPEEETRAGANEWIIAALQATESMSPEEINEGVFQALRTRFDQPTSENEHGFPEFAFDCGTKDGHSVGVKLVLAPNYLLCNYPFGYLRFGAETRVFSARLDDYIAFPKHALRGVADGKSERRVAFLVAEPFCEFLRTHGDRGYRTQFADVLDRAGQLGPQQDLIWPLSFEEQLFRSLTTAAQSYGLPVTSETIVLDPNASEFTGFKRVPPHAIEFRQGRDFVRFTPEGVDSSEEGEDRRFAGGGVLRGWALDKQGRVAVLFRSSSGFVPPSKSQLLRFLSEEEQQREAHLLTVLAELPTPSRR